MPLSENQLADFLIRGDHRRVAAELFGQGHADAHAAAGIAGDAGIPTYQWLDRPLVGVPVGQRILVTDVGRSPGTDFYWSGLYWRPVNGTAVLHSQVSPYALEEPPAGELMMQGTDFQAGLLRPGTVVRVHISAHKSGTTEAFTLRVRLGDAFGDPDPILATITSVTGTQQTLGARIDLLVESETSIRKLGPASAPSSYVGTGTGVAPSAVAVANLLENDLFLSFSVQGASGIETFELGSFTVEILVP